METEPYSEKYSEVIHKYLKQQKNHPWFSPLGWSSKYGLHHSVFYSRQTHDRSDRNSPQPARGEQHIDNPEPVAVSKITNRTNHKNGCEYTRQSHQPPAISL